jgi:hypothetical protein
MVEFAAKMRTPSDAPCALRIVTLLNSPPVAVWAAVALAAAVAVAAETPLPDDDVAVMAATAAAGSDVVTGLTLLVFAAGAADEAPVADVVGDDDDVGDGAASVLSTSSRRWPHAWQRTFSRKLSCWQPGQPHFTSFIARRA